jgi:SAM-dependent methyltransferase
LKLKEKLPPDRTLEQVERHYLVEKAIAKRLKECSREQRSAMYATMYNELFALVPDHPRLTRRQNKEATLVANKSKWLLIKDHVGESTVFAEFAIGDGRFAFEVCRRASFVYGIDISDQTDAAERPANFQLILYDGYELDLGDAAVDVVFSDQLIEHLHPEDTPLHLLLVRRILKPGGKCIFRTPHRYCGPSDVSRYFSDEAEGFHLKEWTYGEMFQLLDGQGWSATRGYWSKRGIRIRMPNACLVLAERVMKRVPPRVRKAISRQLLPSVEILAVK